MKNILVLEEEVETLREKLNNDFIRYLDDRNEEEYKKIVCTSKELDEVIVAHIKNPRMRKINNNKRKDYEII